MTLRLHKLDAAGRLLDDDAPHWRGLWSPQLAACFVALPGMADRAGCERACVDLTLFGHREWQLPAVEELQWLAQRHRPSAMYDPRLFPCPAPAWCWSATPAAWSPLIGWALNLDDGRVAPRPADACGGALAILRDYRPPLHSTASRDTTLRLPSRMVALDTNGRMLAAADEAHVAAVYLPGPELIFSAAALGPRGPQPYCAALCASLALCGWHDWQLPGVEQLQRLVDRRRYLPAAVGHPFALAADWYWTRQPEGWDQALVGWYVDFEDGFVGYQERDYGGLALAVRRGRPAD
ncbi:MAG: DUF1566 domain-containing protein [Pseudomonas sp.]